MQAHFLPQDYIAPRSNGSYAKLMNGVNKLRILTAPILGWEDWIDNKPVRYRMDDKPAFWSDPSKPGKHFWTLIVWNYQEDRIQVLQLTQGSIRKAIEELYKDSDWGAPYFYDIKITREGEGLKTKYTVNPLPHKDVEDHVKEAFAQNPCNLEALFSGQDPFELSENYTEGVFSKEEEVESDVKFTTKIKPKTDIGQQCTQDEMDNFIDAWSHIYDKNLIETYIEKRSSHFGIDTKETVLLLKSDQKEFEKEFKNWSKKYKAPSS